MAIRALLLDVGGVLLTNGWDHGSRELAAQTFGLDYKEMDERHRLNFDTYECGKMTLSQYLQRVVFYQERSFGEEEFREFMFAQSRAFPEMLELIRTLKARHKLKIAVVSNEGRELTEFRTAKFQLGVFIDFFVYSWAVHLRKPDEEIYRLALDLAQIAPAEIGYVEDREMFVDVANSLGMHGIRHVDHASTVTALGELGLTLG